MENVEQDDPPEETTSDARLGPMRPGAEACQAVEEAFAECRYVDRTERVRQARDTARELNESVRRGVKQDDDEEMQRFGRAIADLCGALDEATKVLGGR